MTATAFPLLAERITERVREQRYRGGVPEVLDLRAAHA